MIRIDALWLATEPVDMRAGADTLLARVEKMFGAARPHHAYLREDLESKASGPCPKKFPVQEQDAQFVMLVGEPSRTA